jgi:hypothetical protein
MACDRARGLILRSLTPSGFWNETKRKLQPMVGVDLTLVIVELRLPEAGVSWTGERSTAPCRPCACGLIDTAGYSRFVLPERVRDLIRIQMVETLV